MTMQYESFLSPLSSLLRGVDTTVSCQFSSRNCACAKKRFFAALFNQNISRKKECQNRKTVKLLEPSLVRDAEMTTGAISPSHDVRYVT